jgi:hypothetical protein
MMALQTSAVDLFVVVVVVVAVEEIAVQFL